MMATVSARGYARHRGVSHTAVLKAVADGRITRRPDGKIDAARADREWKRNTDTSRPRNSITGRPGARRSPMAPETPMGMPEPPAASNGTDRAMGSYAAARAIRETYLAKQARMEYEEAEGRLVDAEEVRASAFRVARETQRRLRDLAHQLAPELSVIVNPLTISQVLEAAFDRVCSEMARIFQSGPETPGGERSDPHDR